MVMRGAPVINGEKKRMPALGTGNCLAVEDCPSTNGTRFERLPEIQALDVGFWEG